jgi:hypothetical protein
MKSDHVRYSGPLHIGKTLLVATLAVYLITLVSGCKGQLTPGGTSKTGIDVEAQSEAEKYWNSLLTKCGGTTYGKDNRQAVDQIYEFRDLSIRIKPRKLTDADKQNGIEWTGDANLESKISRVLTGDKWGPWREGSIWLNSETMQKTNGQWKFGVVEGARAPLRTFDCSELP